MFYYFSYAFSSTVSTLFLHCFSTFPLLCEVRSFQLMILTYNDMWDQEYKHNNNRIFTIMTTFPLNKNCQCIGYVRECITLLSLSDTPPHAYSFNQIICYYTTCMFNGKYIIYYYYSVLCNMKRNYR